MDSFRRRPITWLFLIATACVDAVFFSLDHQLPGVGFFVLGQTLVAGGWLVLGNAHRLARAGVFVATILLLASPDFYYGNRAGEWNYVLGTLAACGTLTAIAAWGWSSLDRLIRRPLVASGDQRIRFSVVELLGWMIVVAVASAALRYVHLAHLIDPPLMLYVLLSLSLGASLLMAACVPGSGRSGLASAAIAGIGLALMFSFLSRMISRDAVEGHIGAFVYVALWILAVRLDERAPI